MVETGAICVSQMHGRGLLKTILSGDADEAFRLAIIYKSSF